MKKTLVISNLRKTVEVDKKPFEILSNVSLEVNQGEFVSIIGPSGCGKSVLLYLIAGFMQKTSGKILLDNKAITNPGIDRMMVFQDYVLFPWKNVYENILFALEKTNYTKKEKQTRVEHYINLVGLAPFRNWYAHKLSGGMKQRVAIARALVTDSKILLMDEPFSAIDSQQRKYMQKNLLDIWKKTKKTILFVTHSVNEAIYLSDKIYVMKARPTSVKKCYQIDMSHPRHSSHPEYGVIREAIEKNLMEEFANQSLNPLDENTINLLLKNENV